MKRCAIYKGMITKEPIHKEWLVEGINESFETKKEAIKKAKKFLKENCEE